MESIGKFGETAKGLAKNPLGIIALFIVLIYGFASLVVGASDKLQCNERLPIIWFLVLFPNVVLGIFAWLVSRHHEKLYAPKDYDNDSSFLESLKERGNPRLEIDDIDKTIQEKISKSIASQENIDRLKDKSENVEFVLEEIASNTSKQVIDSTFLTVDASEITGSQTDVFLFPVSAFADLNDLTDEIYFKMKQVVKPFEYGHSWILVDSKTNETIRNARMITEAGPGKRVIDSRSLSEVGIYGGTMLLVKNPKKLNKANQRTR